MLAGGVTGSDPARSIDAAGGTGNAQLLLMRTRFAAGKRQNPDFRDLGIIGIGTVL